jgi:hypothetical protein
MEITMRRFLMAASLAAAFVIGGCATPQPAQKEWDGLELRPVKGLDAVYVRPGVEFKAYKTLSIDPVVVEFDKSWDPNEYVRSASRQMSTEDIQKIKDDMASEFRKVFTEELGKGGYTVVEKPGDDTLRVMPALANVYINAPDRMEPGRSVTLTVDAGRVTLVMELRDGPTGQILARVVDTKSGNSSGPMQVTNRVTNSADFRRAVSAWADKLREGLDKLNGKTPG